MPSPSRPRRRGPRRRSRKKATATEEKSRNWAELPLDSILAVFHKLDHIDILTGADKVCHSWRCAARDEPVLWRRIVMRGNADLSLKLNLHEMACAAVKRSQGQCEAFCGQYAGDDGFLLYLSEQAPGLKRLCLISCSDVSSDRFEEIIPRFPLLEELELSHCTGLITWTHLRVEEYKILRQAIPHLKHFRLNKQYFDGDSSDNDAQGIATIHELRSLQLFANNLTNKGLAAILENCSRLESLDLRHCFNVDMDSVEDEEGKLLREKCARIKTVRYPDDSTDDYHLEIGHKEIDECGYYSPYFGWGMESEESDGDDYSCPSRYEADLDKYEKVLPRSMRTFCNKTNLWACSCVNVANSSHQEP